jgi:hypothetical protein
MPATSATRAAPAGGAVMTTAEFVSVVSTLVSIVVGGLLGVTVLALVDRYCRGMDR